MKIVFAALLVITLSGCETVGQGFGWIEKKAERVTG